MEMKTIDKSHIIEHLTRLRWETMGAPDMTTRLELDCIAITGTLISSRWDKVKHEEIDR
jgi:hypothetical protein